MVRAVILEAIRRGWSVGKNRFIDFDNAEELFPSSHVPMAPEEEESRDACDQWFVPFPPRHTE